MPPSASRSLLRDGETVILVDRRGRRHLKRLRRGHRLTIRASVLACDQLIDLAEGSRVGAGEDEQFLILRPSYAELIPLLERPAEPIFAKDVGLILTRGDIRPGQTVLEIGVGCGALTIALARAVGPGGHLVSYEIREEFAAEARANVLAYEGDTPQWTIKVRDAREGFDEADVDRIIVDVPDAVSVVGPVEDALRDGGIVVVFTPTVLQMKAFHDSVEASHALALAESFEVLERSWHIEGPSVRPDHRMVAHTGFLTTARRLAR
ncbi:MAG: hypothetical protein HY899_03685 [Deltaproteobacteria bacterium]|nr:hypothetical protein [Deltaproteobacteria bacterium]